MSKRGRRSRLLLCFRPAPVEDQLRPTKKLKLPADPNAEEDGDVSGGEITKEKHPHRFSGALKAAMSDIFMTKSLGSRRFRSISLRSPSSKKVQDTNISKIMSETIALTARSQDTNDVFKSNSRHSLSTATITNRSYRALVSPSASSYLSNSRSVLRRNGTFEANLNE